MLMLDAGWCLKFDAIPNSRFPISPLFSVCSLFWGPVRGAGVEIVNFSGSRSVITSSKCRAVYITSFQIWDPAQRPFFGSFLIFRW